MNVGDIIRLNALSMPNKLALICGEARFDYKTLNGRINQVASLLSEQGLKPGDRVAVLGTNSPDYFCIHFACAKLGLMMVPLNTWHRAGEHRYVLDDADPALVLFQPNFRQVVAAALEGSDLAVMAFSSHDEPVAEWQSAVARAADAEPEEMDASRHPHMIVYTSGTTGKPKGAVIGQTRTIADAFAVAGALRIREDDVFINYFPPFHVAHWDHQKLFLITGGTVILQPQFNADAALTAIETERVTVILGVPTMFQAMLENTRFESTDKSSVRLVYYAAYDPNGILNRVAEAFGAAEGRIEMAHIYGLTEAGAFVTISRPHEVFRHWGSIGRAMPGVELALLDAEGSRFTGPGYGEICLRGPMMDGYWRNPGETAITLAGGWLHTGDMAKMDEEGYLWIVDRKKDMIRSGGHNVYSKEVEDAIAIHPAVEDVAVIGIADPVYEEQVCAIIVLKPGNTAGLAMSTEICEFVRREKAGYNVPRQVRFVAELPKNAVGKTQKHVVRQMFAQLPAPADLADRQLP